jgi:hypothetical protein
LRFFPVLTLALYYNSEMKPGCRTLWVDLEQLCYKRSSRAPVKCLQLPWNSRGAHKEYLPASILHPNSWVRSGANATHAVACDASGVAAAMIS